jgi:hypothetical protein
MKLIIDIKHYPEGVYQGNFNNSGQRDGKGSFL